MSKTRDLSQAPLFKVVLKVAEELVRRLNADENVCKIIITYRSGKRPGARVTVTRYADGVTATQFVPEPKMP